jgi:uncharacterized protein
MSGTFSGLEFPQESASEADYEAVRLLIERAPKTAFTVIARSHNGVPVVIRNAPLEADGTPMPTRYWLVGPAEIEAIGRLEAGGGVRLAGAEIDPEAIAATHKRHGELRDAALPNGWVGHRPTGGVAGTRRGVKCLHAHYACWLAGEDDIVGQWVVEQLGALLPAVSGPRSRPEL